MTESEVAILTLRYIDRFELSDDQSCVTVVLKEGQRRTASMEEFIRAANQMLLQIESDEEDAD